MYVCMYVCMYVYMYIYIYIYIYIYSGSLVVLFTLAVRPGAFVAMSLGRGYRSVAVMETAQGRQSMNSSPSGASEEQAGV